MPTADSFRKNANKLAAALTLVKQSANPIALGESGFWTDAAGVIQQTLVDGSVVSAGRSYKEPCRVATQAVLPNTPTYDTTALTYTAGSAVTINTAGIDSVTTLAVGDRVLVKTQVTGSRNGIYTLTVVGSGTAAWVLTRAPDMNESTMFNSGSIIPIQEGSVDADAIYELSTNNPITMDSTSLSFAQAPLAVTYALVGAITSVNLTASAAGVANSVARGDHGHLLDVTIIPTWSGAHTFGAGVLASGAIANDFSGGSGTFKTSTGANTLSGDVTISGSKALTTGTGLTTNSGDLLMAASKVIGFGAPQALSGAGAADVVTMVTLFTSTGGGNAITLADGTRAGQIKFVMHVVDGGSGVLTPATKTNFSTLTLTAVYDWGAMIWSGSAWRPLAYGGTAAFA